MTDPIALRAALKEFLGEERFMKFVSCGCSSRMLFWQEQEWEKFVATRPQFHVSIAELADALRICGVHGADLVPCHVEVFHGHIDYCTRYTRARSSLFPNAAQDLLSTEGQPCDAASRPSWYCPQCREARASYMANAQQPPGPRKPMA